MSYFGTIYADTELPSRARAVYMYLRDRADSEGKCWPGIKTIASDMRLSRSTVKRALTDLEQHGYLQKIPRYRDNGSSTSNLYSVPCSHRYSTQCIRRVQKDRRPAMEEGLQGLLMGAVLVMFLIAMESALQVVDSSEALEQTVEERMMEQRTITVQRISEKESDVFGWMKYLEE